MFDVHFRHFSEENKLLVVRNKELGYYVCAEVSKLEMEPRSGKGVKPSKDWASCEVTYFGKAKETQQLSMRKKISEHKMTACCKKKETTRI